MMRRRSFGGSKSKGWVTLVLLSTIIFKQMENKAK
jgi:hypothetical protein